MAKLRNKMFYAFFSAFNHACLNNRLTCDFSYAPLVFDFFRFLYLNRLIVSYYIYRHSSSHWIFRAYLLRYLKTNLIRRFLLKATRVRLLHFSFVELRKFQKRWSFSFNPLFLFYQHGTFFFQQIAVRQQRIGMLLGVFYL